MHDETPSPASHDEAPETRTNPAEKPAEDASPDPPGGVAGAMTEATEAVADATETVAEAAAGDIDYRELIKRLGPVGILALIAASLPALGGFAVLGSLKAAPEFWNETVGGSGLTGMGLFALGFAVLAGLALLPTYAQSVVAGYAFKGVNGSVAALLGITGASMIGYLIARRASGDRVVKIIEEQPKWQAVYDALVRCGPAKALLIVTLIRIPPNSPFAITNLVFAACRVHPLTYIVGTVVGIAPRTVAAVLIGAAATELDFSQTSHRWFFIGGIVVTIIVIGIIGTLANRALMRVAQKEAPAPPDEA